MHKNMNISTSARKELGLSIIYNGILSTPPSCGYMTQDAVGLKRYFGMSLSEFMPPIRSHIQVINITKCLQQILVY
jgi:hypothetical protein